MIFRVTSVSKQIIIIITIIIITIIIFTEDLSSHVKARSESSGGAVVRALAFQWLLDEGGPLKRVIIIIIIIVIKNPHSYGTKYEPKK